VSKLRRFILRFLRCPGDGALAALQSQPFSVVPPQDPMWERVRQRLVRGKFPRRRHRLTVYAMDTSGTSVVLRCVDIDEEIFLADVRVDADLLMKLMGIAAIVIDSDKKGA
jgi:hypothetical protein